MGTFVALWLGCSQAAFAYVPQFRQILELSVQAMGRIQGLEMHEKVLDCLDRAAGEASDDPPFFFANRFTGRMADQPADLTPSAKKTATPSPLPEGCFPVEYKTEYRFNSSYRPAFVREDFDLEGIRAASKPFQKFFEQRGHSS